MQKFVIGKNEAGQRFDKFLAKYLPNAPKSLVYKMLRKKNITLNGKKATGNEMLSCNDYVESFFSDETFDKFTAKDNNSDQNPTSNTISNKRINITANDIIYEDDNIILINKKPGVLTQKATPSDYSLNEWLIDYLLETKQITNEQLKTFKPSVCNRLDRNTGGIVICGKSLSGIQTMTEIIRTKALEKHYITICHGSFTHEGRIEATISKDEKNNKSSVNNNVKSKKASTSKHVQSNSLSNEYDIITEFKIIDRYKEATMLDVNLLTGKSHQIRAQLASFGNPILGDKKYGSQEKNIKIESSLKYQLLYAYKLIFPHKDKLPKSFEYLADKVFELKVPDYFSNTIKKLTAMK